MLIKCPSCGLEEEHREDAPGPFRCSSCDCGLTSSPDFHASDETISERVWKVKGENGLPVSLRVLRFRVSRGNLSGDKELSRDGKSWQRVDSHPELKAYFPLDSGPEIEPPHCDEETSLQDTSPSSVGKAPPATDMERSKGRAMLGRPKGWLSFFGLASFIFIASGSFFFPLSKDMEILEKNNRQLLKENVDLKGMLLSSDRKMKELEQKITSLDDELEKVKGLNEDFIRAKDVLEDIKKSIDSNKIYLAVSLAENRLYVKIGTKTIKEYIVSTGKGRTRLKGNGRIHNFLTPRGRRIINVKERNPVWYKPNWAWEEAGLKLPETISIEDRAVRGELGKFRLKLGNDGYAIHGTRRGVVQGKKVTHGCIRMARKDLKELYAMVRKGTEVYIY